MNFTIDWPQLLILVGLFIIGYFLLKFRMDTKFAQMEKDSNQAMTDLQKTYDESLEELTEAYDEELTELRKENIDLQVENKVLKNDKYRLEELVDNLRDPEETF